MSSLISGPYLIPLETTGSKISTELLDLRSQPERTDSRRPTLGWTSQNKLYIVKHMYPRMEHSDM